MAYSNQLIDHYENPRNVGSLDKTKKNVGTNIKKYSKEKMKIYRTYRAHCARYIPTLDDGHICKEMHGHTFNIVVSIAYMSAGIT